MSNDDFDFIQQCLDGNRDAFRHLVQKYQVSVFNAALRLVCDRETAKDIAQETFVKAFTRLNTYDARYPFRIWIIRIAMNAAIDLLRKGKLITVALDNPDQDGDFSLASRTPDGSLSPLETLEQAESANRVRKAVAELDPKLRSVVVLRHFENMDYEQIAETLQIPMGTVKNRLFRAREQLQESLKPLVSTSGDKVP